MRSRARLSPFTPLFLISPGPTKRPMAPPRQRMPSLPPGFATEPWVWLARKKPKEEGEIRRGEVGSLFETAKEPAALRLLVTPVEFGFDVQ